VKRGREEKCKRENLQGVCTILRFKIGKGRIVISRYSQDVPKFQQVQSEKEGTKQGNRLFRVSIILIWNVTGNAGSTERHKD